MAKKAKGNRVQVILGYGLYGIMKGLSNTGSAEETAIEEKE